MGNWALSQAQAFLRQGMEVSVVSGTSWIPRALAIGPGAKAYADCPASLNWGGLTVTYPRWLFYPVKPFRPLLLSRPGPLLEAAWMSVRGHLLEEIRRFRPDVVYAHHTQVNGYMAWRLHQATNLPYVITDHDFGELESCRSHPARYALFSQIAERCACMISVARRMERLVADLFPRTRTSTVHNGSDPPDPAVFSRPRPPELSSRLVIFSACKFYERKGIPLLVRAFGRIAARFPDAVLRIGGDGETRPDVEAAIREAGIASQVQLLGAIPHRQVLQEMAWADVFALPGWNEPFATVFTEALSAGCPIIYASDGGITDVAVSGVHGFSVEPRCEESAAQALEAILADGDRRRAMAVAARELFETKLPWDRNAAQMNSVFANAMSRETAPSHC